MADPEVSGWRNGIILGTMTALAVANSQKTVIDNDSDAALSNFLLNTDLRPELWGEGAVASIIPWMIWRRKLDATIRPDIEIFSIAKSVIKKNQQKSENPLPNPYYGFEEIFRHRLSIHKGTEPPPWAQEDFAGSSYTATTLMHLTVRTKVKQFCQQLWPDFSKLGHLRLVFKERWHYCLVNNKSGIAETYIYPPTNHWEELKKEALSDPTETELPPAALLEKPWILALWWQIAPQRVTPAATKTFLAKVIPDWGR